MEESYKGYSILVDTENGQGAWTASVTLTGVKGTVKWKGTKTYLPFSTKEQAVQNALRIGRELVDRLLEFLPQNESRLL